MSRFCPFLPDGNPRAFNQPVVTDRCDRVMFPVGGKWAIRYESHLSVRHRLPDHPKCPTHRISLPHVSL